TKMGIPRRTDDASNRLIASMDFAWLEVQTLWRRCPARILNKKPKNRCKSVADGARWKSHQFRMVAPMIYRKLCCKKSRLGPAWLHSSTRRCFGDWFFASVSILLLEGAALSGSFPITNTLPSTPSAQRLHRLSSGALMMLDRGGDLVHWPTGGAAQ